ncbi:SagB/ThcOx family dehydrogenase [Streptomyces sp. NPDC059445]|uniref:SagB/ThcOx family dehydrogenase n=1 Tax=Streptomyces sp. NPDC059445 TaxID=3346832 RepID=UPI003680C25B
MPLVSALRTRASERTPSEAPLPLPVLSSLLKEVFGPGQTIDGEPDAARRSYPSAGARFPTECYVIAQRTADLEPGVYHYDVPGHGLHSLRTADVADDVLPCFGFPWIAASRAVLVLTAALPRTTCKYGERGYRFALLEAGHACENLLLLATAFGVPATPVGGFADAPLARLLGLVGGDEPPIATLVLP